MRVRNLDKEKILLTKHNKKSKIYPYLFYRQNSTKGTSRFRSLSAESCRMVKDSDKADLKHHPGGGQPKVACLLVGCHGYSPLQESCMSVHCMNCIVSMEKQGGCGILIRPYLGADFFYTKHAGAVKRRSFCFLHEDFLFPGNGQTGKMF